MHTTLLKTKTLMECNHFLYFLLIKCLLIPLRDLFYSFDTEKLFLLFCFLASESLLIHD